MHVLMFFWCYHFYGLNYIKISAGVLVISYTPIMRNVFTEFVHSPEFFCDNSFLCGNEGREVWRITYIHSKKKKGWNFGTGDMMRYLFSLILDLWSYHLGHFLMCKQSCFSLIERGGRSSPLWNCCDVHIFLYVYNIMNNIWCILGIIQEVML